MSSIKAWRILDTQRRTISYLSLNATHKNLRDLIALGYMLEPNT